MDYLGIKIECNPEFVEILIAELAEVGFESFVESDQGLLAFIPAPDFKEDLFLEVIEKYNEFAAISFSKDLIAKKNWNEEWEKQYDPIVVEEKCLIRAPFHQITHHYPIEIVIQPKMSFGTGHHDTTYLMVQAILSVDLRDHKVLDVGCGTGILALLALKKGARKATAIDVDPWSVENTLENSTINQLKNLELLEGTIRDIPTTARFHNIFANINRNVILEEIKIYASLLMPGGSLLCSGFYKEDASAVEKLARNSQLDLIYQETRNNWACLGFKK